MPVREHKIWPFIQDARQRMTDETYIMNTLTCYAISEAALRLLAPDTQGRIPDSWFNWTGAQPSDGHPNAARLTRIDSAFDSTRIIRWENAACSQNHATVLILTEEEKLAELDLFDPSQPAASVSDEMGIVLLTNHPADAAHNTELLNTLQQPDYPLAIAFSDLRGGGAPI